MDKEKMEQVLPEGVTIKGMESIPEAYTKIEFYDSWTKQELHMAIYVSSSETQIMHHYHPGLQLDHRLDYRVHQLINIIKGELQLRYKQLPEMRLKYITGNHTIKCAEDLHIADEKEFIRNMNFLKQVKIIMKKQSRKTKIINAIASGLNVSIAMFTFMALMRTENPGWAVARACICVFNFILGIQCWFMPVFVRLPVVLKEMKFAKRVKKEQSF